MANCVSRYQIYSIAKVWTIHDKVTNDLRDKFGCGKKGDKYGKQEICKLGDDLFDGSSVLRGSSLKSNRVVRIWTQRLPTSIMTI